MSFSWRNLLGSNGAASSSAAGAGSPSALGLGLPGVPWNAPSGVEGSWDEVQEARLLGMVNFGNTCYANSVLQALYFCKPFRDSMLAYNPPPPEPSKAAGQVIGTNGSFVHEEPSESLVDEAPSLALAQGSFSRRTPSSSGPNHLARPGTADTAKPTDFGHKRRGSGTWGFSSRSGRGKASAPTSRNPSPTRSTVNGATDAAEGDAGSAGAVAATEEAAQPPKEPDSLFVTLRDLFSLISSEAATKPPPPPPSSGFGNLLQSAVGGPNLGRKVSTRPTTAGGRLGGAPSSGAGLGAAPAPAQPHVLAANGTTSGGTAAGGEADGTVDVTALKGFLGALKRENVLFNSTAHQDAHEFLNFILNRVGEDLVAMDKDAAPPLELKGEGSVVRPRMANVKQVGKGGETCVHRLFEGTLTNETRCLTCETVTSRDESFLDLSIDIERNSSITSCLRQFSASEMLCSRNKFFCDTCSGLQEAEKRMKIKRLPNVLALHLKRFKYEEQIQRFVKLAYRVVFPFSLRLFNTSDDAEDPDRLYDLFAIVVHLGTGPHHGHYIAIVKVGRRWCVFDDENVTFIEEADISRYYGDTPGTGSAYVLFYQARDLDFAGLGLPPQAPPTWAPPPPAAHRFASVSAAMAAETGSSASTSPFSSSAPNGTESAAVRVATSPQAVPIGLPVPHGTTSGTATPASGSGFFARRQTSMSESTPGATLAAAYSTSSGGGAMTSSSASSASGGWLSSLRGGRERRATNSSVAASATTADSMSNSLTLPPPSAFKQPATLSAPHSTAPSSAPDTDDAASTRTSSTSASAALRGRAAEAAHLGAPIRRGSSASPAQLPTTLVEEPTSLEPDSAPLAAIRSVAALNGQVANGAVGADDAKTNAPVVTAFEAMSQTTAPQANGATLAPTPRTPTRSATMLPVTASVSAGGSPYAGAAFLPADRPLSKKEQQKIAKTRRISGVPSLVNVPPTPPEAGPTPATIKRRSTLGGRFGFGRNKDKGDDA